LFSKMQNLAANVILVVLGMLVLYAGYQCFFILPGGNVLKSAGAGYTTVCISLSFFGICFLAAIFLAIERMNVHTVRRFNRFLFAAMILLQCCFTIVIWKERVLPSTDLATDTTEAIQMLQTHQFWQNSSAAIYPHNRMHILILYFYYRILSCMRIYQYWEASILLALFCIDVSVFFSCKIIRLLSGVRTELVFLLFCFLNPVTYLGLAYYYTSIISLPFMMISSYCIVKLIQERENKHWSIYAFLCGFFSASGVQSPQYAYR